MAPRFEEIELELAAVSEFRDTPAGTCGFKHPSMQPIIFSGPRLLKVLPDYPDIKVEITVDYALADIVAAAL